MKKHKIKVELFGDFTTVDVFLEGKEIPLREVSSGEWKKEYGALPVSGTLDLHVLLKGWINADWKLVITVGTQEFKYEGTFENQAYVSFTKSIEL